MRGYSELYQAGWYRRSLSTALVPAKKGRDKGFFFCGGKQRKERK